MIEGSLKFHSEKMSFEKSKTRYPKTRLSCSHYQESEGFLGCLWQRIWSAIHFRLRSLKPRRTSSVLTKSCKPEDSQSRVDRQTPDRDESFGWGLKLAESVSENVQEASKSFSKIGTRERKVPPAPLYRSYSLSVDLVAAIRHHSLCREAHIYRLYMCEPTYVNKIKRSLCTFFAPILSLHHPETSVSCERIPFS